MTNDSPGKPQQRWSEVAGRSEKMQVVIESAISHPSLVPEQIVPGVDLMRNTVKTERMFFE